MKNIITIVLLFIVQITNAQRYDLTQTVVPFVPLSNPSTLVLPQNWDDDQSLIVLPFNYSFFGSVPTDSIYVFTNASFTNVDFNADSLPSKTLVLFGSGYDLVQKPITTVKYKIEGEAPNRKLTVQYLNAGFYNIAADSGNINIQNTIWENGCFSTHIGSAYSINNNAPFDDGIFAIYAYGLDSICYGLPEGTALNYAEGLGNQSLNDGSAYTNIYPGDNNLIEFCPRITLSTNNEVKQSFSVYPNPANERMQLIGIDNKCSIVFYDITGKIAMQVNQIQSSEQVDVSKLNAGIYLLKLIAQNGKVETLKFIKN
jgi:hypothetical protein